MDSPLLPELQWGKKYISLPSLFASWSKNLGQWAGSYLQGCTFWLTKDFSAHSQGEGQDNQNPTSSFGKKSSFILSGNHLGVREEHGEAMLSRGKGVDTVGTSLTISMTSGKSLYLSDPQFPLR